MRNLKHEKVYLDIFKKAMESSFKNKSTVYKEYEIYTNLYTSITKETKKLSSKRFSMLIKDENTKGYPLNPYNNCCIDLFFSKIKSNEIYRNTKYIYLNNNIDDVFENMSRKNIRNIVKHTLHIVVIEVTKYYSYDSRKTNYFLDKAKGVYLYSFIKQRGKVYSGSSFNILLRERAVQNKIVRLICKDNSKRLNNALTDCIYDIDHIYNSLNNKYANTKVLHENAHRWFLSNPESIIDDNFDKKYFHASKGYVSWSESWDICSMNCKKMNYILSRASYNKKKKALTRFLDILTDDNIVDNKGVLTVARYGANSIISYLKREDLLYFIGFCEEDYHIYNIAKEIKLKLSLQG